MTPYARAWETYHSAGDPPWSWAEVVSAHFRCGAVVSTARAFVLARRVHVADADEFHLSPLESRVDGDCWMIWIAAGRLDSLLALLAVHPVQWISYQRRGAGRIRRVSTSEMLRRHGILQSTEKRKSPARAATDSPAGLEHGQGADGRESGGATPGR